MGDVVSTDVYPGREVGSYPGEDAVGWHLLTRSLCFAVRGARRQGRILPSSFSDQYNAGNYSLNMADVGEYAPQDLVPLIPLCGALLPPPAQHLVTTG